MLLARHHGMGSSKPSDQEMPFGYTFPEADTRIPSPVDPPPGPDLLDDNENKYMQDFFSGFGNDAPYDFNTSSFVDNMWELPPEFLGTSSSFGQPPQSTAQTQPIPTPNRQTMNSLDMDLRAHDAGFSNMNGNLGMHHGMPSTSPDVYRAASTLIQSNHNGRQHSMGNEAMFGMHSGDGMLPTNGHSIHQPMYPARPRSMHDARPPQETYMPDNYYVNPFGGDMNPGAIPTPGDPLRSKGKEVEIRWGSDMGFGNEQGFVPPPGQETAEEVEKEHIRRIMSFAPVPETIPSNEITLPTRPSSPRRKSIAIIKTEDDDARLRKRRKSKFADDEEEEEEGDEEVPSLATGRVSAKKRKSTSKPLKSPSSPATEVTSKRKKSSAAAAAAAKATRENLTEDQKRENHIRSEQKRRTLIREGFSDLGELVPGLQGGGFSKSAVLLMAADFLERLLDENKDLQTRVTELENSG